MSIWIKAHRQLATLEQFIRTELSTTDAHMLTVKQVHVLNELYSKDGQQPSDLAKAIGLKAASFTPILDIMENAKLITRQPDQYDRRAITIHLTVKGQALKLPIYQALDAAEKQFKG